MREPFRKAKAPAPRKLPKGPKVDQARRALKLHTAVTNALAEIKIARGYLAKQYAGPEHEALEWAESILEKASKL